MLRHPDAARSSSVGPTWRDHVLRAVVCLSCVAAGAALITMASPRTWLSAGASASGPIPDTVLLDFTATWCGPCQQMSPIIDRLAQQGYPVRKVDVDQHRALAERFQVKVMPTFVLVVNGREVMRQSGVTSEAQLRRMLLQIPNWQEEIARENRPEVKTVAATAQDGDFAPTPFAIDLGAPSATPTAFAQNEAPKRGFGLPLFQRRREEPPAEPAFAANPPVVRGQSSDAVVDVLPVAEPMQASTRLRVKDAAGLNFGSGTIVESRVGRTLILTCGHIFRHLGDDGLVEVDVFLAGRPPVTYVGKVIHFDLDSDVGLVAIPTTERLSAITLGSPNTPLQIGDTLTSIGCGGGEVPSKEGVEVTAINKYKGPDNIECTGLPIQGRSGGGLFRGKELIGLCILADPKNQRGVYTGLAPIYELLEQTGFGHLLPIGRPAAAPAIAQATEATASAVSNPFAEDSVPAAPPVEIDLATMLTGAASNTAATEAAAASELSAALGQSPDAEVICIVRPKNPQVPSRVVIIHQASPKLVGYLLESVGDLPSKPASMNDVFAQSSNTLIPTTATEAAANPFAPIDIGAVRPSMELSTPTRPMSPRQR